MSTRLAEESVTLWLAKIVDGVVTPYTSGEHAWEMSVLGAFAAEPISAEQAQNREAIGSVSVSAIGSSPMDMNAMLSKKA
ncbi:DUF1471 domain-containing protein, partial [Salmonella enterica subsp. enterica serovar Anatum]|nr:DUF1471 domain-containing protein [Salmonella enterica subsp. enterica serovar Anatum]